MLTERPYQTALRESVLSAWANGAQNVMAVLPTGGGKTVIFSRILADTPGRCVAIAHRQELVEQISVALARNGVRHNIVAPNAVVRRVVAAQAMDTGRSVYDPQAKCAVAGVDTLLSRASSVKWLSSINRWVIDEGHHLLAGNKWGRVAALMPQAQGLAVTATPCRADGNGLGRHADGLIDAMVSGPTMRDLITAGYLTDYRIVAPPLSVNLSGVNVSATTGDYSKPKLVAAIRKSTIVGDVLETYRRFAAGKKAVVFATDVETATGMAARFNAAGFRAAALSAKTKDCERGSTIRSFRAGGLNVLVNVDLFGEGFDLPAIEVVIMARPTESLALYMQQFGRGLRPMDGKSAGLIIDHVGNVTRHGLPDKPREWTLNARERGRSGPSDPDVIPIRSCLNPECLAVYERIHPACPYCGHRWIPASRDGPEQVDGDLVELDPDVLARMRGEIDQVDKHPDAYRMELQRKGCPALGVAANVKRHVARQEAQHDLRQAIAEWAGIGRAAGRSDSEMYRRFWFRYGVDVMTAQTLRPVEAVALTEKIKEETSYEHKKS